MTRVAAKLGVLMPVVSRTGATNFSNDSSVFFLGGGMGVILRIVPRGDTVSRNLYGRKCFCCACACRLRGRT